MPDRPKGHRRALTVRIDAEVIERLKRVAREAAGKPLYATVQAMVEAGIMSECDRIEGILAQVYRDHGPADPPVPSTPSRRTPPTINNCDRMTH